MERNSASDSRPENGVRCIITEQTHTSLAAPPWILHILASAVAFHFTEKRTRRRSKANEFKKSSTTNFQFHKSRRNEKEKFLEIKLNCGRGGESQRWHQSKGWRKITFNWKEKQQSWRKWRKITIFPVTINSLKAIRWLLERAAEQSHYMTLWYLSYFRQLWLEICCWRNFFHFSSSTSDAVDSALPRSQSVLVCTCCVRDSRLLPSKFPSIFASSFSRQSFHPRAHTFISISLLALSNKISLLAFLPPFRKEAHRKKRNASFFRRRNRGKVSTKLLPLLPNTNM